MNYSDSDRTLALAGVFQAARLTDQLARRGMTDAPALSATLHSILHLNPDSVAEVFNGIEGVAFGLRTLVEQLDKPKQRDAELTRYSLGAIQLAIRLGKDAERQAALAQDIDDLNDRRKAFDMDDARLYAPLADLYQRHISPLSPRIMVKGDPLHLQNPDTAARIRTALLGGVRAAHLWLQCGGNRWQLVFKRPLLIGTAQQLLAQPDAV
jgi:high frequency lysogenization protein